ncbi:MAG: hypothetical protein VYE40_07935 [Myxococcota bacterium]|nr:hypothetical protein [Myxococcota bacterium]
MSTCPPEHPEQDHTEDHTPRPGAPWSPDEVETLKTLYPSAPWEDLLEALPGRSPGAIGCKAKDLKIKRETYHSLPGSHTRHRASPGGSYEE